MISSIRGKLTLAYAIALVATVVGFAAALLVARRASVYRTLASYVDDHSMRALGIVNEAYLRREQVTVVRDSTVGAELTEQLKRRLYPVPDYVLVMDTVGRTLYASFAVTQLTTDDIGRLSAAALQLEPGRPTALVQLARDQLIIGARFRGSGRGAVSRVAAGVSVSASAVAGRELVGTMLVISPFLFALSLGGAYVIAGRALRPVDHIINQVEAITDGRSLHRRLPVDGTNDELARLAATLNEMIGRLESSFGGLRRFTADASHELKTPLTVMRADVERAMAVPGATNEQLVALEEALQETTRMADLVESLLTLARADEGRFDLHREPVALGSLARDVFETAMILGEGANLTVVMARDDPATVLADATRLRQLCLNLVTNAIKYTPAGGRVELALERRGAEVLFSVKDSGIGISAADLPHVFERFWRADHARSRSAERGGFGLGLAISQYIAQAHGGGLTVTSRLGRGSQFTVTLPVAASGVAGGPHRSSTSVADDAGTGMHRDADGAEANNGDQ